MLITSFGRWYWDEESATISWLETYAKTRSANFSLPPADNNLLAATGHAGAAEFHRIQFTRRGLREVIPLLIAKEA